MTDGMTGTVLVKCSIHVHLRETTLVGLMALAAQSMRTIDACFWRQHCARLDTIVGNSGEIASPLHRASCRSVQLTFILQALLLLGKLFDLSGFGAEKWIALNIGLPLCHSHNR